jgi:hypothetical protein
MPLALVEATFSPFGSSPNPILLQSASNHVKPYRPRLNFDSTMADFSEFEDANDNGDADP